ncbi:MAG: hypothetical protein QM704_25560 [Anaeromyxobacteraceae bacterium]
MARSTAAGSRHQEPGSTSASTGVAPVRSTACAVAAKVRSGTITSSPGPSPSAWSARWRATVPFETVIAWRTPTQAAKAASNRST